jgi:hypothetical protein
MIIAVFTGILSTLFGYFRVNLITVFSQFIQTSQAVSAYDVFRSKSVNVCIDNIDLQFHNLRVS